MKLQLGILLQHSRRVKNAGLVDVWDGLAQLAFGIAGRTLQWPLGWDRVIPREVGKVTGLYGVGTGFTR